MPFLLNRMLGRLLCSFSALAGHNKFEAYPSFCTIKLSNWNINFTPVPLDGMPVDCMFTPGINCTGAYLHTWMERNIPKNIRQHAPPFAYYVDS